MRTAGEQLHVLAADALMSSHAETERLRERILQLEAVARLNLETILAMQIAATEAAREAVRTVRRR